MKIIKLILFVNILIVGCNNKPTELVVHRAIHEIENSWTDIEKEQFKNYPNVNVMYYVYKNKELYTDSLWSLKPRNRKLVQFFNQQGIFKQSDMTNIMYRQLYYKMHQHKVSISDQIKSIKLADSLDQAAEICEKRMEEIQKINWNKFEENDTILVKMNLDRRNDYYNAILVNCPSEWDFDPATDLVITGLLKKKIKKEGYNFRIKILDLNYSNVHILSEKVDIGDEIDVYISYNIIEHFPSKNTIKQD